MDEEVRKKLKDYEDVLELLNEMILHIDRLMETVDKNKNAAVNDIPQDETEQPKRSNQKLKF